MKENKLLIIGFSVFGLLIGYVTGITKTEISQTILTALFAFMGGKVFIDFNDENKVKNKIAGIILLLFSILFLIGLNAGIYIKVNKLLTKTENIQYNVDYLRSYKIDSSLESKYRRGEISADSLINIIFNEQEKK